MKLNEGKVMKNRDYDADDPKAPARKMGKDVPMGHKMDPLKVGNLQHDLRAVKEEGKRLATLKSSAPQPTSWSGSSRLPGGK